MPIFSSTPTPTTFNPGVAPTTLVDQQSAANTANPVDPGTPFGNAAGMAAMAPLDLLDTIASNKYVSKVTGVQRGALDQGVLNAIGQPGLTQFYNQHQQGIEALSGIGGAVAAGVLTDRFITPGLVDALSSIPYARRIAQLDAEYTNAVGTVKAGDLALAARGASGTEQYAGAFTVDGLKFDSKVGQFVPAEISTTRSGALFKAKALGAAVGARNALIAEGVAYSALNSNGFLYQDDAASNVMWQALGVAGGAVGNFLHTGYQARKFVNSDMVRRTFANAYDPDGIEVGRLLWHNKTVDPMPAEQMALAGAHTDEITSLLASAESLNKSPVTGPDGAALLGNRQRLAVQQRQLAAESAQKVVVKGIGGINATRFTTQTPGYGTHLIDAMDHDKTVLLGAEMVGGIPDSESAIGLHKQFMDSVNDKIDISEKMLAEPDGLSAKDLDALQANRRRLDFMSKLTPMALVDRELLPLSEASVFDEWKEPSKIQFTNNSAFGDQNAGGIFHVVDEDGKPGVSLDTSFDLHIPGGKDLAKADLFDVMRAYRAGGKLADHMANWTGPIQMPAKPTHFQLDLAENLLRKTQGRAQIVWPQGMDRESAMVESFAQKADAMRDAMRQVDRAADPESLMAQMRMRFNLPRLNSYERGLQGTYEAPSDKLLRGAASLGTDQIRAMPLADLKQSMAELSNIRTMGEATGQQADTVGNSFSFMQDSQGRPTKPLLIYKRPMNPMDWSKEALENNIAARQLQTVGALIDPGNNAPMTQQIAGSLMADPDTQAAMSTHELMDNQIQGSIVGLAPQSFGGSIGNALRSSDFAARDTPTLLAAGRIQDKVQRVARDMMRQTFDNAFGGAQNALKNPRNTASELLLNQFHSFRSGWDLEAKPVMNSDGFASFKLGDTQANRDRWFQQYKTEMPKGQTLLAPGSGKEVVLDQLALDLQQRFNQVSDRLVDEKNALLRARGLQQINKQNWYVPPPNTNGKYIGWVFGPDGKIVPNMGVVAATPGEFDTLRAGMMKHLADNNMGLGYTFRTQQDVNEFANIWDRAQMDMMNPGITAAQPGKSAKGLLTGQEILPNAFDESMRYLRDQHLAHANDIIDTIFHSQINANKARASMAAPLKANNTKFGVDKFKSIYDMYNESLLGRSKLNDSSSVIGQFYNKGEGAINSVLSGVTPTAAKATAKLSDTWTALNYWVNRNTPWSTTDKAKSDFEALTQALGPHMPFASAAEMIEKQGLGARPWTATDMARTLNQFSSTAVVRMLEVVQPIIHLASIVNAMPAVIRSFAQRDGEAVEDYAARVGHSAMIFNLDKGNIAIPDMVKIGQRALTRAWSPTSEADYEYMVQRGFLGHEMAEFNKQFGAIDSKSSWSRFMNGDQSIGKPQTVGEMLAKKGVVGWMSTLTDKSYDFTRAWGHMIGLELADHLGIVGRDNTNNFAHDIANKMIANYAPHNRPEVFQGAIGSTLGLFQRFMQEYYQRMFRYVETKDHAALVHQFVMQGSLFGVNSLPGFSQYNQTQAWLDKHGDDPEFTLRNRLGKNAADFFQHGILANIPTLMGQDGISINTRGDAQLRVPGVMTMPPGLQVAGRVANGVMAAANAFWNNQGTMTRQQMAEILANAMPNRPIAGLIQQISGGDQVDAGGQLVADTQTNLEMMYRVLGMHSTRQQDQVDAYYANKDAMTHKAAADGMLRLATRAAIRGHNTEAVPAIYQKYVENGGDPRQFSKWLKENQQAATSTRGARQLEQDLKATYKDPIRMGQISRLLDSGVTVDQDADANGPGDDPFNMVTPDPTMNQPSGFLGVYPGQMTMAQPGQPTAP